MFIQYIVVLVWLTECVRKQKCVMGTKEWRAQLVVFRLFVMYSTAVYRGSMTGKETQKERQLNIL